MEKLAPTVPFLPDSREAFASIVVLLLAFLWINGCIDQAIVAKPVNESTQGFVRLEARYGGDRSSTKNAFAHPLALSESDWARLLGDIYVQRSKALFSLGAPANDPIPAFSKEEVAYLAKYFSTAFAMARPDQWVGFFVVHGHGQRTPEVSSGGLFAKPGEIHFVLANYRKPISMDYVMQQIRADPLRPTGDSFFYIVPQANQNFSDTPYWYGALLGSMQGSEMIINYASYSGTSTEASDSSRTSKDQTGDSSTREDPVAQKLNRLKRLKEDGLLTEKEYQTKRKLVLDNS